MTCSTCSPKDSDIDLGISSEAYGNLAYVKIVKTELELSNGTDTLHLPHDLTSRALNIITIIVKSYHIPHLENRGDARGHGRA